MDPQPSTSPAARLSPIARVALGASFGLFLLVVWIPTGVGLSLLGALMLWGGAAAGLLHSGGIALPTSWFNLCSRAAVVIALMALWSGARVMQRERTVGPGGRVLFVRRHLRWRWPRLPLRFHAVLLGLIFVIVYLGEWDGNPWLPDVLSLALLLTALYAYSASWPLAVLSVMTRLGAGLLRFARRGPLQAGVCGTLMLASSVGTLQQELERSQGADPIAWPVGGPRALLVALADDLEPALALREELRRFFAPLMDAVPQALGQAETSSARTRMAGDYIGDPDLDVGDPVAWQQCMSALWPEQVRFQQRALAAQFSQFDRDQIYDVVMGTLVRVCLAASNRPVTSLKAYFEVAARRLAINYAQKERRGYSTFCGSEEDTDFYDRCPGSQDSPEDVAEWRLRLAQVNWCELTSQQRAFIIESNFLGMSDQEIAERHGRFSDTYVKDTRNNAYKKIRKKLGGACLFRQE